MSEHAELPHDLDAERAVLASILMSPKAIDDVAPWLMPDMFYSEVHKTIYQAALAVANRNSPVDLTTIVAELKRTKQLDRVGGASFLIMLPNSVPTADHVDFYARPVERTAALRRVIQTGGKIAALGYTSDADPDELQALAEGELAAAFARKRRTGFIPMGDVVNDFYALLNYRAEHGVVPGLKTGFNDYDKLTGGLQRSDLLILAARPAVGKTSLALNIAYHAALHEGARVGIFSLEMSRDQLMQRILATHTGVDMQKLRNGQINEQDLGTVAEALGVLSALPILIDDSGMASSLAYIRSECRRMATQGEGLDLIIIDYMQLMHGTSRKDGNRVLEISEISRGLKEMARELNVPILALSQLSRAVENRLSKVPLLSDLRESGSLEQDADIVMFIYREELYDPATDKKGIAELHIAKHRNGPTGIVPLRFFRSTTRFANLETYRQPEEGYR